MAHAGDNPHAREALELEARLVEGHKLLTEGPFRVVRHPIYAAMLGMLLANRLAVSRPAALLPALVVYGIGGAVRIRSEDKLLREMFGREFEVYARRVPAVFPRLEQWLIRGVTFS